MKNGKGHGRLFDRTLNKLSRAWRDIAATSRPAESRGGGGGDEAEWRERMAACLEGRRGAVTARASAAALGHEYLGLDEVARKRFLGVLGRPFRLIVARYTCAGQTRIFLRGTLFRFRCSGLSLC